MLPPCAWDADVWNEDACVLAASYGHLEVLQLLRSQKPPCPWSVIVCVAAAENGHLDVRKWVRSLKRRGDWTTSAWDAHVCTGAA
jgi:hypothetical protein